jgi:hypothetical protein
MSVMNPAHLISRQPIDNVAHWAVYLTPAIENPKLPEEVTPNNPVPAFMASQGLYNPGKPNTIDFDLMNNAQLTMWDGKKVLFYLMKWPRLKSPYNAPVYPAPTLRIPRGVVFHGSTHAHGPPPHTIHWHGIEPTPLNDGVGHCSAEIGNYIYQFQPNFCGQYFYHCHRNTVQHFEYGLFGSLIVEPPDAFQQGPGRNPGGYPRRTSANTRSFPQFPGFVGGRLDGGDPQAMTIPYDVEALWVLDDVDSTWREIMSNARDGIATPGSQPGVNDKFIRGDFHDYNSDYWFVTGVPFAGPLGSSGAAAPGVTIPAALNSGVSGMQVSVNAKVNQTVLIRMLCAAYDIVDVTLPVDAVVIGQDGRALGVEPVGSYSQPYRVAAGTPIRMTSAIRFDLLVRRSTPVNAFASVQFRNSRDESLRFTGRIPFVIT